MGWVNQLPITSPLCTEDDFSQLFSKLYRRSAFGGLTNYLIRANSWLIKIRAAYACVGGYLWLVCPLRTICAGVCSKIITKKFPTRNSAPPDSSGDMRDTNFPLLTNHPLPFHRPTRVTGHGPRATRLRHAHLRRGV